MPNSFYNDYINNVIKLIIYEIKIENNFDKNRKVNINICIALLLLLQTESLFIQIS